MIETIIDFLEINWAALVEYHKQCGIPEDEIEPELERAIERIRRTY